MLSLREIFWVFFAPEFTKKRPKKNPWVNRKSSKGIPVKSMSIRKKWASGQTWRKNIKRMLMRQSTVRTSILDVWRFVFCSPENLTELHEVILQWFVRAVVVCIKKENRSWGQNEFHADPTRNREVCRLLVNHCKNVQLLNQLFSDLCLPLQKAQGFSQTGWTFA